MRRDPCAVTDRGRGNKDPKWKDRSRAGGGAQLFQSWQMWRPHSQERWSALSSSVKKDVTT